MNKPTFKELYYLCMQKLTNFPYIEQDFDALTNYELLCKVVEELNKMIQNINTQNESIIALYNAFNELKEYIDNYFENLDVQEEINNKLDEMAEDGTLTQLIQGYIDPIFRVYREDVNSRINEIQAEVESVASGSPLVATSTSEMTDTTKTYVNTTNGKWYYYDGDSWEIGGTYQSTGIADGSITPVKTSFFELEEEDKLTMSDVTETSYFGFTYTVENNKLSVVSFNGQGNVNKDLSCSTNLEVGKTYTFYAFREGTITGTSCVATLRSSSGVITSLNLLRNTNTNVLQASFTASSDEGTIVRFYCTQNCTFSNSAFTFFISEKADLIRVPGYVIPEQYINPNSRDLYQTIDELEDVTGLHRKEIWEQGYYNQGVKVAGNQRIRTAQTLDFNGNDTIAISCDEGYYIAVGGFDSEGNFVESSDSSWVTSYYLRKDELNWYVQVRNEDNTNVSVDEATHIHIRYLQQDKEDEHQINNIDLSYLRGFAHRCRSSLADAQNTIDALTDSFYKGQKIVEIDIRITSDGKFVICHDPTINAVSNGTGDISSYTLEQLETFDFSYLYGQKLPKYIGTTVKIATLEEMLFNAKKNNMYIALDMVLQNKYKNVGNTYVRDVYNMVKDYHMENNVIWHFANIEGMKVLLGLDPNAIVIYSVSHIPTDYSDYLKLKTKKNIIGFTTQYTNYLPSAAGYEDNVENVKDIVAHNLVVFAYTINQSTINQNPTLIDDLLDIGFIGIGSDDVMIEPLSRIIENINN